MFLSLIATATCGYLNHHGNHVIPSEWLPRLVAITIALAIIHGILGLLLYF